MTLYALVIQYTLYLLNASKVHVWGVWLRECSECANVMSIWRNLCIYYHLFVYLLSIETCHVSHLELSIAKLCRLNKSCINETKHINIPLNVFHVQNKNCTRIINHSKITNRFMIYSLKKSRMCKIYATSRRKIHTHTHIPKPKHITHPRIHMMQCVNIGFINLPTKK